MPGDSAVPLVLRWRAAVALALLSLVPFLFVRIPPLTDMPGHIGAFAVELATAPSPILRYFAFHWRLAPNQGAELLIEPLAPVLGLWGASWLLCALVPPLTVAGAVAVARVCNPRGAYAAPWALVFVYSYPLLKGFLDYSLTLALTLPGFALWARLADRAAVRAAVFAVLPPLLMIGHGVAGVLLPVMIVGWELGRGPLRRLTRVLWPLATSAMLAVWFGVGGTGGGGLTQWQWARKLDAWPMIVRDQNMVLDIGTVVLAIGALIVGGLRGARFSRGALGVLAALLLVFIVTPSQLAGSDRLDTRLAPLIAMMALLLQDWSGVAPRVRRPMAIAGAALLAVRLAVTAVSFAGYDRRYAEELAALDQVRPGARVLNLTQMACGAGAWRDDRLQHLSNLATPLRHAWVNSHWSVPSVHMVEIVYRPSEAFAHDPSQFVWPQACGNDPSRRSLADALRLVPYDRIDYLWLIDARLPRAMPGLRRVWRGEHSELYLTVRR